MDIVKKKKLYAETAKEYPLPPYTQHNKYVAYELIWG